MCVKDGLVTGEIVDSEAILRDCGGDVLLGVLASQPSLSRRAEWLVV
jgi:hypothetical protein